MDVDFLPQISKGKPALATPTGYPWTPRGPMDVHPYPPLGLWISMDKYGELSMLSMVLYQPAYTLQVHVEVGGVYARKTNAQRLSHVQLRS